MMEKKAHRMLKIAADMQKFGPQDDKLEQMTQDAELSAEDLDFVAAAAAEPQTSFAEFLKHNGR